MVANPADDVGPSSIATFVPKDRSLSPTEIRIMLKLVEKVVTLPTIRLGMRLYLQTMVRKTLLNELGFNSDWIEKCLAHEDGRSSRGVYNKAEYEMQRRHMMQE